MTQSADGGVDCIALDVTQVDTPLEENVACIAPFSGPLIAANPVMETGSWVCAITDDCDGVSTDNIGFAVPFSVNATPIRLN